MPSITEDYESWLKYQKQKWKIQKQARIRRRKLFGERTSTTTNVIGNFFRNQAELVYVKTWQILQLKETDIPGEVRMFVLIDHKIHALTVKPKQKYLMDVSMEYIFLYHVVSGDRQIFAIYSSRNEEAHIVILTRLREVQGFPNVDKIYKEALEKKVQEHAGESWQQIFDYQDNIHFKTTQVTTRRKALLEVGDVIKKFRIDSNQAIMLVVQSPQRRQLTQEIPIIKEHPVLPLRSEASDNDLPPLGWQPFVAKQITMHYLALGSWLYHLVLWWSPSPLPDHAGYEKDDILGPMQKVDMPSSNNPGAYSSVCIELEIRNLAINTILTSSLINELEGSESTLLNPVAPNETGASDGTGVLYSDTAFASAGILVLRDLVKSWWAEACQGNGMADIMVQHLIRWVESSDSFLYDRSLHYHVQMMSKKAFQQLMTDFRRMGSQIIFASPSRLLLQTTKGEVANAYAYSQYIVKSIKEKPLFHFLDLEIKEYWDYLVWYDEFNFGGKGCQEVVETENQELETVMHWQLSKFLPTPLQTVFLDWVVEYIELMHGLKRPTIDNEGADPPRATQLPFQSITESDSGEMTSILTESFSKPLKRQIAGLIRRQRDELLHPELASDYVFPTLPGASWRASKHERNPTLELVKSLMQVLSLCKTTTLETRLLRRELLALFEVKEFSDEGRFENPSGSLKFPQLICNHCTMTRDLDICRDGDLLPENSADNIAAGSNPWCCLSCATEYDRLALEERLIGQVQGLVVEWQTQDLKCSKCKSLRVSEFMEHCSCSGSWVATVDLSGIKKKLSLFKSVAEFYGLRMLTTVTNGVLERM
ncbi:predicted protein [Histoplasma mississippiense (nom. inval.)]|uniref:predicted protein n=1 Tax=Ajellomyces capsulatus (strain NAm1 / WU24) TaxID=2059318 RepID=UPI000157C464|nr:predicted protein [Histoplasma mississippiense (nom. inval.)]EDN08919.1 predicted protein [Histoplasma mississippiense (nom. inval.)]